ncbi:MAG: tryptophan-rich sensory protein [Patescibacteria group bacterium]|jgi:hypothetical protein
MKQKESSVIVQQILVIIATIGTIGVNALANIIPLNGYTTGAVSNAIPMFFVPAGYVFSIWSLIYISLTAFAVYQALPKQREPNKKFMMIRLWYILSCLANSVWIVLWHYLYVGTSVVIMLVLLFSLIMIYLNLYKSKPNNNKEHWLLYVPFSLYLSWITVATITNISAALTIHEWDYWGVNPTWWAAVLLAVATIITVSNLIKNHDLIYGLVIIWAFIGIIVKFPDIILVSYTAGAMIAMIVITLLFSGYNRLVNIH